MSPENDLLFSQPEALLFPELGHFSDLDEFSKDLFLNSAIEGLTGASLLEELSCKDDSKPLIMSELNAFSSSLNTDKDVEKQEPHDSFFAGFIDAAQPATPIGFISSDSNLSGTVISPGCTTDKSTGLTSTIRRAVPSSCAEQGEIMSPKTVLTTDKMHCMSLDEMEIRRLNDDTLASAPAPPTLSPLSPYAQTVFTIGLMSSATATSTVDTVPTASPPILQINSPVSSPSSTMSTSDGASLLNRMLGHEETGNVQLLNPSLGQATELSSVTECSSISTVQSPRGEISVSGRGAIPPHVVQEASSHFPTMQRSHSSHALGQFRTLRHSGASSEEFVVTPAAGIEMPMPGFSSLGPFMHYQALEEQGLAERSPVASMRRVFSTGDLQAFNSMQASYGSNNASHVEQSEDNGCLKIGHYTMEERKARLNRYRQKRTERNFSRKIKYACRKTLADSRPRIRGRFARTDDIGESILKENGAANEEEYDDVDSLLMVNGKCVMSTNPGARFWNVVGMKAAM